MQDFTERIAGLSPQTLQKLADRLRETRPEAGTEGITRPERPAVLPMSYGQEALWLLERLRAVGAAYNEPLCVGLKGRLQVAALERALRQLVRRHEILRTHFAEGADGQGVQVVEEDDP